MVMLERKLQKKPKKFLDYLREKRHSLWHRVQGYQKKSLIVSTMRAVGVILVSVIAIAFVLRLIFTTLVTRVGGMFITKRSKSGAGAKTGTGVLNIPPNENILISTVFSGKEETDGRKTLH